MFNPPAAPSSTPTPPSTLTLTNTDGIPIPKPTAKSNKPADHFDLDDVMTQVDEADVDEMHPRMTLNFPAGAPRADPADSMQPATPPQGHTKGCKITIMFSRFLFSIFKVFYISGSYIPVLI